MRVEVDSQEVDAAFDSVIKDFQKVAALPGFRPGKAPRDMVSKRFEKDIQDEVKKKLIPDSYRKALREKNLDVIGSPDFEEIQFGRGQSLQFAVTMETAPEFQLPEYKGLPAKREAAQVTDADVDRAIELLRNKQGKFETANRAIQTGDYAVVNYTATSDGKPLAEIASSAKSLGEQKAFWVNIEPGSFLPGFAEQLLGAAAGDKRTVTVDFPAEFVTPELSGRKAVYEVEIVEVKQTVLPALDEAFAKSYGAESVEKLRAGVRTDLDNELKYKQSRSIRNQLIDELLRRVSFDLPETAVAEETRGVVYDIVRENQQRGVSKELIEQQRDAIFSAASNSAKTRVKVNFLLQRIAEKEQVKISKEEVGARITRLAALYQIPVEQFVKDLEKRNGILEIYDQVATEKVLDLLQQYAVIEDVPAQPA